MRYYVKLSDKDVPTALYRVEGVVGEYLERASGRWVADPTVAMSAAFDTDVFEVTEPASRAYTASLMFKRSRRRLLTP